MEGHITLMDYSNEFSALLIAFNSAVLVVSGDALGRLVTKGELPESFQSILSVSARVCG